MPMTSKELKSFLDDIREAETELNIAIADEAETNRQTQDILHAVEMRKYNPRRTAALVKTLCDVRTRRRMAKETIERLTPIVEWSKDNQSTIKSLERLLGDLRKTERRQEERMYCFRTDILEHDQLIIQDENADKKVVAVIANVALTSS